MGSFDELEKVRVLMQSIIEKENKERKVVGTYISWQRATGRKTHKDKRCSNFNEVPAFLCM